MRSNLLKKNVISISIVYVVGGICGIHAEEVEDDFLDERETFRGVVLAEGTGIFLHGDIEYPVQRIFDAPV